MLTVDVVSEMTKGDGVYGLGTIPFSEQFGIGTAYGHSGDSPDHTSLLIVIPAQKVSVSVLLADGNRNVDHAMGELTKALQPLLN